MGFWDGSHREGKCGVGSVGGCGGRTQEVRNYSQGMCAHVPWFGRGR